MKTAKEWADMHQDLLEGVRLGLTAAHECAIDNQDCSPWELADAIAALNDEKIAGGDGFNKGGE